MHCKIRIKSIRIGVQRMRGNSLKILGYKSGIGIEEVKRTIENVVKYVLLFLYVGETYIVGNWEIGNEKWTLMAGTFTSICRCNAKRSFNTFSNV